MYSKHYKGIMYGAKNIQCDFLVTRNHKMWARQHSDSVFDKHLVQSIFGTACAVLSDPGSAYTIDFGDWYTVEYDDMVYCPTV